MRVAIQFYGFMRYYETTYPLWKRLIDEYNADVFIHTWDTEEYKDRTEKLEFDSSGQMPNSKKLNTEHIVSLYKPIAIVAEKYADHHETFKNKVLWMENFRKEYLTNNPEHIWINYGRYVSYASMYYTWLRVSQLKQKYELANDFIYDYVIHARTDFALTDIFSLDRLTYIITPPWPNSSDKQSWINYDIGINDYWACGPSKAMDVYCSVYYNMEKIRDACMNTPEISERDATNAHVIPVVNLSLAGTYFLRHNNQHGNILR